MFGPKESHPDQMELIERLEETPEERRKRKNRERQRKFREKQLRESARKPTTLLMTAEERYYIERVLDAMRNEEGSYPAALRTARGTFIHLDV